MDDIKLAPALELAIKTMAYFKCYYDELHHELIDDPALLNELLEFKLVEIEDSIDYKINGAIRYVLTDTAYDVIEHNRHVVKYPLSDEKGNVASYNEVIKTMSPAAINALILAFLNEEGFKKVTQSVNKKLHDQMEASTWFYRSKMTNPIARLDAYKADITKATLAYKTLLGTELSEIGEYTLTQPIPYFIPEATGNPIFIVGLVDSETVMLSNGNKANIPDNNEVKYQIVVDKVNSLKRLQFKNK